MCAQPPERRNYARVKYMQAHMNTRTNAETLHTYNTCIYRHTHRRTPYTPNTETVQTCITSYSWMLHRADYSPRAPLGPEPMTKSEPLLIKVLARTPKAV